MSQSDFLHLLSDAASKVDATLQDILQGPDVAHAGLASAMSYAAIDGGKRLRGFLCLATADIFSAPIGNALRVASAIEAVHAYSLIHDDLPCMDDDDMRRGKPSLHKATNEATAVLAGDGLLTLAFSILSDRATAPDAATRLSLVAGLAHAAGAAGMVAGQAYDMDNDALKDAAMLLKVHRLKTGALIRFSVEAGALIAGADDNARKQLISYAENLGLAFQIIDDVLDVTGEEEKIGKTTGKDQASDKLTFVSVYGVAGAKEHAARYARQALEDIAFFGARAEPLRQAVAFVIERES